MKKLLTSAILLLALAFPFVALASNPTVTISQIYVNSTRVKAYTFSFATGIATADSAFILPASGTAFDVGGGQGAHALDSLATLELSSSETTADSVRFTVLIQGTSAVSPEFDAGDLKSWATVLTDATTFTNAAGTLGGNFAVIRIPLRRLLGQMPKMRIIIFENNTTTDATQTVTGRLLIPIR